MSLQRLKNEGVHRPFGVTLTPPQAVLAGGVITAVSGYGKEGKEGKEGTGVKVRGKEGTGFRYKVGADVRCQMCSVSFFFRRKKICYKTPFFRDSP